MTNQQCGFCQAAVPEDQLVRGRSAWICRTCLGEALVATLAPAGTELPEADLECSFCGQRAPASALYQRGDARICGTCLGRAYELEGPARALQQRRTDWKHLHQRTLEAVLRDHFAPLDPTDVVTRSRTFPIYQRVDVSRALGEALGADRCAGVKEQYRHQTLTIAGMMRPDESTFLAPLHTEEVDVGEAEPVRCYETALWRLAEPVPAVVLLTGDLRYGDVDGWVVEIGVLAGEGGEAFVRGLFRALEEAVTRSATYRGKVLSLEGGRRSSGTGGAVTVHKLSPVGRDDVILPASTLELLERNVFSFARHRAELRRMGLPVKKGLLFYGPPGTGKTHTIRYLAGALPGHTTLLVTAEQIGLLPQYMALARLLVPSIVVIEDADLIARQRERADTCEEVLLNQLLNEMDGLRENTEILFVLTTNRPEALEVALTGRPGRIDQAIEFPLPDAPGRLKLARLYGSGVPVTEETLGHVVDRTDGVSAAFLKELMRRSTQFALERGGTGIERADVDAALDELLFSGGRLNAALLGAVGALSRS